MTADGMDRSRFDHVPERIGGLVDIAFNLWWSWHPAARVLFKQLNAHAWKESRHNPVQMLREVPVDYLKRAARTPEYLRRYDIIMERYQDYMARKTSWFTGEYSPCRPVTVAYFSAEYGLHHSLPFYAGGLGFLAGDHLKECSDLGVPLVAVGFMYSSGYLHQHIGTDGSQMNIEEILDRDAAPITRVLGESGRQIVVRVPLIEPPIHVAVWKVQVGRVPLYLLDTDIAENRPEHRGISHRLYGGDREERLLQEIVLGIGGRKVLSYLGVHYSGVHINEGHPAFALIERVRERIEQGFSFEDALEQVRGTSVFTTHTPLPAGTDIFPFDMVDRYLRGYYECLGIERDRFLGLGTDPGDPHAGFNMTVFAMRMSAYHNAVSARHGEVTRGMWKGLWPGLPEDRLPIDAITNGVHLQTWLNPRMEDLFDRYIGSVCPYWQMEHDNPVIWELVDEIPDGELWHLHIWLKMKLINRIREMKRRKWAKHQEVPENVVAEGVFLNPSVLTIGFARRFSTYKRADLIFHDLERLKRIVNNRWHPVQIIFAGKAHPDDVGGQDVLRRIYRYAQSSEFGGKIAFVEDYGEQMAQYLVHGVDLWLNNPLPPMEASGTSGMKAAINGVINLSILDGWWVEGYNGRNGWAFGGECVCKDRTDTDAGAIYDLLEQEIVPLYYQTDMDGVPHGWVRTMKESIKSNAPRFCSRRMLKEYVHRYYPRLVSCAGAPLPGAER
ncbi:alpha-glucan family phosphorylase [Methanofollis fontis]|uniref:Alpha-glucan phosphorylase n=1 Tax=Methanofollis fontis TaxID=2052832 RepID=A0A483CQT4_9EURY|nr:alpha-glucan family phosphorylase [Methanofollis fontis]TAJ45485.1 alpha-glucan phosphorylase [Methanofollis fontis]